MARARPGRYSAFAVSSWTVRQSDAPLTVTTSWYHGYLPVICARVMTYASARSVRQSVSTWPRRMVFAGRHDNSTSAG